MIIPDGTRTMPMPLMFEILHKRLRPRVKALDYLVALGTHPLMSDAQLSKLIGQTVVDGKVGDSHIFNHHWEDRATFVTLGSIPAAEISRLTSGLMAREVPVTLRSEEHTSELQSRGHLVCRLLLEKKKKSNTEIYI